MTTFYQIDETTFHDMQVAANLKDFLAALDVIAPVRARGLGQERAVRFIEHSLHWGSEFDLPFRDQVIYLMFIMNFLGSYFWTDPRFVQFAQILDNKGTTGHEKIAALHREFAAFSDRFIGEDYGLYWDTLERTAKDVKTVITTDSTSDEDILLAQIACHQVHGLAQDFPIAEFLFASRQAARVMGMDSQDGCKASVILSYWFGTSYFADPLFPWIKDISAKEKAPDKKAQALLEYALKRFEKARLMRPKQGQSHVQ